jgi:hypothetical protein
MTIPTAFPTLAANSTSTLVDKVRYMNISTDYLAIPIILLTTFVIGYVALARFKPEHRVIAMSFICMTASLFLQGAALSSWSITGAFLGALVLSIAWTHYTATPYS